MDNLKLVLFVVNPLKENINSSGTNIDTKKISIEEKEEEVIFLPFSGFEICDLDESGKYPIISLNYLTKYEKKVIDYIDTGSKDKTDKFLKK